MNWHRQNSAFESGKYMGNVTFATLDADTNSQFQSIWQKQINNPDFSAFAKPETDGKLVDNEPAQDMILLALPSSGGNGWRTFLCPRTVSVQNIEECIRFGGKVSFGREIEPQYLTF